MGSGSSAEYIPSKNAFFFFFFFGKGKLPTVGDGSLLSRPQHILKLDENTQGWLGEKGSFSSRWPLSPDITNGFTHGHVPKGPSEPWRELTWYASSRLSLPGCAQTHIYSSFPE